MPRHRVKPVGQAGRLPEWVKDENDDCLVSVAEDAYKARGLAYDDYGAHRHPSCVELLRAAEKSLRILNDSGAGRSKRCAQGDRAARKFWEAKVCARRVLRVG